MKKPNLGKLDSIFSFDIFLSICEIYLFWLEIILRVFTVTELDILKKFIQIHDLIFLKS